MTKIIKWLKSFFIKPKPKFPYGRAANALLSLTIDDLRKVLEGTIDQYCEVHLGKPKQYWVTFCDDRPYKFSFLLFDECGHATVEYTIVELLDNLTQMPSLCWDRIVGKLRSVEFKRDYKN